MRRAGRRVNALRALLRCATALRVTHRPSRRSGSSYGALRPGLDEGVPAVHDVLTGGHGSPASGRNRRLAVRIGGGGDGGFPAVGDPCPASLRRSRIDVLTRPTPGVPVPFPMTLREGLAASGRPPGAPRGPSASST